MTFRERFVRLVYATHNSSEPIARALDGCTKTISQGERVLNVGSGHSRIGNAINLDLVWGVGVSCCGNAEALPFVNEAFALVISQETLEHVGDPFKAVTEIFRVLKPGGRFYCQVPFIIGYHPGPTDFWRFSREGIQQLVERAGFVCDEVDVAVGPGTGFYRICVEFAAVIAARLHRALYYPVKGVVAIALFPIKWLDRPLSNSAQVNRIAGGYYAISSKPLASYSVSTCAF